MHITSILYRDTFFVSIFFVFIHFNITCMKDIRRRHFSIILLFCICWFIHSLLIDYQKKKAIIISIKTCKHTANYARMLCSHYTSTSSRCMHDKVVYLFLSFPSTPTKQASQSTTQRDTRVYFIFFV